MRPPPFPGGMQLGEAQGGEGENSGSVQNDYGLQIVAPQDGSNQP
jgi:hypothetical protein